LTEMVGKYPERTWSEYCEYWRECHNQPLSPSMMCRELKKQNLTRKKKQYEVANLRPTECKFWGAHSGEKVKKIEPQNLVFLDEMGVLLGLTRTHARSYCGSRVYDLKPFYRGALIDWSLD
jgi:hypothetical protein